MWLYAQRTSMNEISNDGSKMNFASHGLTYIQDIPRNFSWKDFADIHAL